MRCATMLQCALVLLQLSRLEGKRQSDATQKMLTKKLRTANRPRETATRSKETATKGKGETDIVEMKGPKLQKEPAQVHHDVRCTVIGKSPDGSWTNDDCGGGDRSKGAKGTNARVYESKSKVDSDSTPSGGAFRASKSKVEGDSTRSIHNSGGEFRASKSRVRSDSKPSVPSGDELRASKYKVKSDSIPSVHSGGEFGASKYKVKSDSTPSAHNSGGAFHFAIDDPSSGDSDRDGTVRHGSSDKAAASHGKGTDHHFDVLRLPKGNHHQIHTPFEPSENGKGKGKGGRNHHKYKGKGGKKKSGKGGKGGKDKSKKGKGKGGQKENYSGDALVTMQPTIQPNSVPPTPYPTAKIITERPVIVSTERPVIVDPPPRKPDLQQTVAPTPARQNDPLFTKSPINRLTRSPSVVLTSGPTDQASAVPSTHPTMAVSTNDPTAQLSAFPSVFPSADPTTSSPTLAPETLAPVIGPSTTAPTVRPTTVAPTQVPTKSPSLAPITALPSLAPVTEAPAVDPTTLKPTQSPTVVPSVAPTTAEPTTSATTGFPTASPTVSPTEPMLDGIRVSVSRFEVDYDVSGSVNDFQFGEAERITLEYLQQFMEQQFGFNSLTDLIDFRGTTVATDNASTKATYDVDLIFSDRSIDTPSSEEADLLVFAAFNLPFVPQLVTTLTSLPTGNPFFQTSAVTYNPVQRRRWLVDLSMLPGPPGLSFNLH